MYPGPDNPSGALTDLGPGQHVRWATTKLVGELVSKPGAFGRVFQWLELGCLPY
jgi:hypothetical protein